MEGPAFVKWIEKTLIENDIAKDVFYAESGISTANMSQWRTGDYNPSSKSVRKAEAFFEKKQKENPTVIPGGAKEQLLSSVEKTDDLDTLLAILDAVNKKLQKIK